MREIKFRAWGTERTDLNNQDKQIMFYQKEQFLESYFRRVRILFINWKLMQYTGLKDKNREDIYEGDILEWGYGQDKEGDKFRAKVIARIGITKQGCEEYTSHHVGFMCEWLTDEGSKNLQFTDLPDPSICKIKVIGNIYENPELLEVKNVRRK